MVKSLCLTKRPPIPGDLLKKRSGKIQHAIFMGKSTINGYKWPFSSSQTVNVITRPGSHQLSAISRLWRRNIPTSSSSLVGWALSVTPCWQLATTPCCLPGGRLRRHLRGMCWFSEEHTMWGPPVINWFINPSNYSYKYHKP